MSDWSALREAHRDATRSRDAARRMAEAARSPDAERWRRETRRHLAARATAAGQPVEVRLELDGRAFMVELARHPMLAPDRLRAAIPIGAASDEAEAVIDPLIDRRGLAERRRAAIGMTGMSADAPEDAPAWAYLAHPVARAMHLASGRDLATWRPMRMHARRPGDDRSAATASHDAHEFRLATHGLQTTVGGVVLRIAAADEIARIRIGQRLPDTVRTSLVGRPLHQLLGLPGIEAGTAAGDAPILRAIDDGDVVTVLVECALEPMGDVPEGIDTAFLTEWSERHRI